MVQESPGESDAGQLLVAAKAAAFAPEMLTLLMMSGVVPTLFTRTLRLVLELPFTI